MAKPKMILVVDDDPNLLMFFKEYFKQEGYNALLTEDPQKAIRTSGVVHPDLLIIDIRMPKIDGFGVLAKVRERTPEIKTMIVSSYVQDVEEKIREAHVEAVLKKPIQFEDLEKWILKLLKVTKEEIQEKIPPGARPQIRVLFVDDEEDIADWMAEAFNEFGFVTDKAYSGEEALEKAKQNHYDLIFTDHSMRSLSGCDLIKKMRVSCRYQPHAIAVSSASLISEIKEKYADLGVVHFFSKPTHLEVLIQWMESQVPEIVKKRQGSPRLPPGQVLS